MGAANEDYIRRRTNRKLANGERRSGREIGDRNDFVSILLPLPRSLAVRSHSSNFSAHESRLELPRHLIQDERSAREQGKNCVQGERRLIALCASLLSAHFEMMTSDNEEERSGAKIHCRNERRRTEEEKMFEES